VRILALLSSTLLIFAGCSNHSNIAPSQNSALQSVSPSATSVSEGGKMQHALDNWLKNEWIPLTLSDTVADTAIASTRETPNPSPSLKSEESASKDEGSFTLQHYADKWERYHENQKKLEEKKVQETSHIDLVTHMPIIGK